ncbi:hypothetical protein [Micromonospora purpureochromogenes]|uniref:hypothetical protein n=1 Tax=Micromonospora purpureochromogenes TaxID=47872 RepID=UPI000B5AD555|nr:hypothetical protein [Micromonospora purpureochromogenes]
MIITFDAIPDRDRLAAALRSSLPPMLVVQVPAAVLGLVGAFGLLTGARAWPLTLLALGALAYRLVPELLFRRVVRHCWRLYGRPTAWQIDATGVRRITELTDSLVRWEAVTHARVLPAGDLVLAVVGRQVLPVPTADLPPVDRDDLLALLRERNLIPGQD